MFVKKTLTPSHSTASLLPVNTSSHLDELDGDGRLANSSTTHHHDLVGLIEMSSVRHLVCQSSTNQKLVSLQVFQLV